MYAPHKSWLRMNCNLIYLTEMSTLTQVTYNIIICSYSDACIDHVNYDGQVVCNRRNPHSDEKKHFQFILNCTSMYY